MKAEIKIIQDYFLNKIYNCEFEICYIYHLSPDIAKIKIDDNYVFYLWLCNGNEGLETYVDKESFIKLSFDSSKSNNVYEYLKKELNQ